MLTITVTIPTKKLPIRRSLAKLTQSFIYSCLDDKEHDGYKHPNGKVFKATNFKVVYVGNEIIIKFVALNKEYEKIIAQKILTGKLKLGEIHIARTEMSLIERHTKIKDSIKVGGFVSTNIKDGEKGKRKIYLEPKSNKFQDIIYKNTLDKYQALFGKPYEGELKIKLIEQKPKERLFFYSKSVIKAWFGVYEITANRDLLEMILDTGMGADAMKGVGFVEILK
jgi:CRISPR-associated endoribonuclease Cas6